MPDITALVAPRKAAAASVQQLPARGLVAAPPASVTDDILTVTLPSYSADYGWPCRWVRQGNMLPAAGAECLVLWDETGAGTVVQWAGAVETAPPQARVYNSANISIPNNTVTVLTFNSERFDSGDLHSTSSNTGRLVAPITGLYSIGCNVQWGAAAAGLRLVRIVHSVAGAIARDQRPASSATDSVEQIFSTVYQMLAGAYMTVEVFQTSGGALNVQTSGGTSPEFWMHRVGSSA